MDPSLKVDQFREQLYVYLSTKSVAYSMRADTKTGRMPVGIVTGVFVGPLLYLDEVRWHPWASSRNKLESAVNALNELRKKYVAMFLSPIEDKEFFVRVARHGVIRRIGSVHDVHDTPAAAFQTRAIK